MNCLTSVAELIIRIVVFTVELVVVRCVTRGWAHLASSLERLLNTTNFKEGLTMEEGHIVKCTRILVGVVKKRAMRTLVRAAKLAHSCKYYAETLRRLLDEDADCQKGDIGRPSAGENSRHK